jgi:GNAT superfamily N-acetyltransferase
MMDAVDIRRATMDDSSALADLSTQLGYPTSQIQSANRLGVILDSNKHAIIVACLADGTVVGWVHVFLAFRVGSDPFAEIGGFVVTKEFRRRGIGRCLLEAIEEWVIQSGIAKLRIRSRSNRVDTHIFYGRLGFSKSKQQHVFDKSLKPDAEYRDSVDAAARRH